jgi:hypothetical protein
MPIRVRFLIGFTAQYAGEADAYCCPADTIAIVIYDKHIKGHICTAFL